MVMCKVLNNHNDNNNNNDIKKEEFYQRKKTNYIHIELFTYKFPVRSTTYIYINCISTQAIG